MARTVLPHVSDRLFLSDGGIETALIYLQGQDLPDFAAFPLLDTEAGRAELRRYYEPFLRLAGEHGAGFVLETPTWRASADWGAARGYDAVALRRVNDAAVHFVRELADSAGLDLVVVSGCIGPRDDGYVVGAAMTADEATGFHTAQVDAFAGADADVVTAITMTYPDEAIGVARAAAAAGLPAVISFTVETDGRLPDGSALGDAIARVDAAAPGAIAYFMVNCAHPTHFDHVFEADAPWLSRVVGIRANASTSTHAELDAATDLDAGDPDDLAARYAALRTRLPNLSVFGGCCGTDARHVSAIAAAVTAMPMSPGAMPA